MASRIGLNLGGRTYFSSSEDDFVSRLYRRSRAGEAGMMMAAAVASNSPRCQAEGCNADLSHAKHYHRRHKVCEFHSKAATVIAAGLTQRFCQQCSRLWLLCLVFFILVCDLNWRNCPSRTSAVYPQSLASSPYKGADPEGIYVRRGKIGKFSILVLFFCCFFFCLYLLWYGCNLGSKETKWEIALIHTWNWTIFYFELAHQGEEGEEWIMTHSCVFEMTEIAFSWALFWPTCKYYWRWIFKKKNPLAQKPEGYDVTLFCFFPRMVRSKEELWKDGNALGRALIWAMIDPHNPYMGKSRGHLRP